jgi:hypothetical protein
MIGATVVLSLGEKKGFSVEPVAKLFGTPLITPLKSRQYI